MATYQRGEYVSAADTGRGLRARGSGTVSFSAGDELLITSIRPSGNMNVRHSAGGSVFVIHCSHVQPLPRRVGQPPVGAISPEDPAIMWLWEDASRMADRLGLCKDYDRLCDALGIPGRVRTFKIELPGGDGIKIVANVEARSRSLATQKLLERINPARLELTA